jgi:hypothetical protein
VWTRFPRTWTVRDRARVDAERVAVPDVDGGLRDRLARRRVDDAAAEEQWRGGVSSGVSTCTAERLGARGGRGDADEAGE